MSYYGASGWSVRVGLPVAILVGGIAAASLFRRQPDPADAISEPRHDMTFRQPARSGGPSEVHSPTMWIDAGPDRDAFKESPAPAVILKPIEPETPPPSLPKSYPHEDPRPSSRWGVSMGIGLPRGNSDGPSVRRHKIADGDTLAALARRYYHDPGRAKEIYQANRDVLRNPDILPIGVELLIPASDASRSTKQPIE